jgi:hypothetical protein
MPFRIAKLITVVIVLLCGVWIGSNPDWEPKITALGFLAAYIGMEFVEEKRKMKSPDAKLFKEFQTTVPSTGDISYLRMQNMGGTIDASQLRQLEQFAMQWDNAEHEFADNNFEKKKLALIESIREFMAYFATHTWNIHGDLQHVPPEWQDDQPERWRATVSQLNELSDKIVSNHQDLVRFGRKKLRI